MKRRLLTALWIGLVAVVVARILDVTGAAQWFALGLAVLVAFVALLLPRTGVEWLDALLQALRAVHWGPEHGQYHSHAGVPVQVHDDGRHAWIDGESLQRILRTTDSEEVLAARHAGHWRHFNNGPLMLRVDAVVTHLATAPGRLDPRIVRLRRWLERDVLFPAAERRRRTQDRTSDRT